LPNTRTAGDHRAGRITARLAFERRMVTASLARHAGHRSAAARELGLSRQGLAKAIKRLGVAEATPEGTASA
jgi:DNA-binding NtrC family response regulator